MGDKIIAICLILPYFIAVFGFFWLMANALDKKSTTQKSDKIAASVDTQQIFRTKKGREYYLIPGKDGKLHRKYIKKIPQTNQKQN